MNTDPDTDVVIDNEAAVIAEAAAEAAAANEVVAAPAAVADDPPAPVVEAAPDPIAAAIAENAAATRALAEKLTAQPAPTPEPAVVAEVPRDFDAELSAAETALAEVERKYEEGEDGIDAAALAAARASFRTTERGIIREQARADAAAEAQRIAAQHSQQVQDDAKASDEAKWKAASDAFQADPGNAKLLADEIQRGAFQAAINVVARDNPGIAYPELLVKAREKVTGVASVDPGKAIKDAEFARTQETRTATPTTLRDVPNAGETDNAPGSALDNLGISELEDALFRMSDADRNRYLADAPGGLRDNPRYTG